MVRLLNEYSQVEETLRWYHDGFMSRHDAVRKIVSFFNESSLQILLEKIPGSIIAEIYDIVSDAPKNETEWHGLESINNFFAMNSHISQFNRIKEKKELHFYRQGVETLRNYFKKQGFNCVCDC